MQLSFLTIGTRLGLAFGLLVLMMLGASAVGVLRLGEVGVINERIIDDSWVKSEAASLIDATTRANARLTMELVITTDLQRLQAIKGNIAVNKKSIDDAFAVLQQKVQLPEGKATLARLSELRGKYVQSFGRWPLWLMRAIATLPPRCCSPRLCQHWTRCKSQSMR